MSIYLSIAFTLLAAVAGLYLLAKTKAEGLGKLYSVVSYLVIIVAGLSLTCQLGRGITMMACRTGICTPSENCMPGMMIHKEINMRGMGGDCKMHSGCREEEMCCESRMHGGGMGNCCDMEGGGSHGDCCKGGEGKKGCMEEGEAGGPGMKGGCKMDMKKDSAKAK
jgi:hypothetical protein